MDRVDLVEHVEDLVNAMNKKLEGLEGEARLAEIRRLGQEALDKATGPMARAFWEEFVKRSE